MPKKKLYTQFMRGNLLPAGARVSSPPSLATGFFFADAEERGYTKRGAIQIPLKDWGMAQRNEG